MMRVLLLAAGRGERMRPLTDGTAKPLLEVGGRALIEHHIARLAAAGFRKLVVNLSWHGGLVRERLGDGARFGASIVYSDEGPEALETAGGVVHALPLLGDAPFAVVNSDIWTDYDFGRLVLPAGKHAHLVLVPNPKHNASGDFALSDCRKEFAPTSGSGTVPTSGSGSVIRDIANPSTGSDAYTFAGIAVYSPKLFAGLEPGKRPLAPLLRKAAERGEVSGEVYDGEWTDVGTPARLQELRERIDANKGSE